MNGNIKCADCIHWKHCPESFSLDIDDDRDQCECPNGETLEMYIMHNRVTFWEIIERGCKNE